MVSSRLLFLIVAVITTVFTFANNALAQQVAVNDDDVNRVAKSLYCPTCASQNLSVCPTETCNRWRAEIRRLLAAGKSEEEVIEIFIKNYGEEVVGVPSDSLGRVLSYGPLVILFLLASWGILHIRKRKQ